MPRSNVSCGCGAELSVESQWSYDVIVQVQAFNEAHAECRKPRPTPEQPDE